MFFKSKGKVYLKEFLELYIQALVKSDVSFPSSETIRFDKEKFSVELLYFRLVVLYFLITEIEWFGKKRYDLGSVENLIAEAYALTLPEKEVKKVEAYRSRLLSYVIYLSKADKQRLKDRGIYFHLLMCFADLVVGEGSHHDESFRDKRFVVFDFGKQIYRNDEKALRKMLKNFEFSDEAGQV